MAFRSRNFHALYLAAESFVFARDAAEPQSLKLLKSSLTKEQPKNNHVKELNRHFLEWESFIGMFSFPTQKAPGARDCIHQSRGCYRYVCMCMCIYACMCRTAFLTKLSIRLFQVFLVMSDSSSKSLSNITALVERCETRRRRKAECDTHAWK